MPQWPTSGASVFLRLRPRPSSVLSLCVVTRACDRLQFSSYPPSTHGKEPGDSLESANGSRPAPGVPQSSIPTPPELNGLPLSNATAGPSGPSPGQTVTLDVLRNRLKERAQLLTASATLGLAEIGGRLNKVTGYEHIEMLKRRVVDTEAAISERRQASRDAKAEYEMAVARRSNSQREVNDLLQRKSSWTEADVSRFTALVREDHLYEQEEARAKTQVAVTEAEVETVFNELMRTILNRYHEEQVWSDKIRSASTYGSLLVLGVNVVVFFLAIVVVEPWKRRRLAQTFEKRIEELSLENRAVLGEGMSNLAEHFEKQERVFAELMGLPVRNQLEDVGRTEAANSESRPAPPLPVTKTAKAARDRDLWIAGTAGVVAGGALTFLLGFLG